MKQIELIFKVFFVTLVVTFLSAQQDCWQAQVSICVLYREVELSELLGLSTLQKFLGGRKHFPSGWSFSVKFRAAIIQKLKSNLAIQKMGGGTACDFWGVPKLDSTWSRCYRYLSEQTFLEVNQFIQAENWTWAGDRSIISPLSLILLRFFPTIQDSKPLKNIGMLFCS